ncbi:sensor histidine kinase ResE [Clostridium aceticum]|uniref:histidine kinase n=1 Tax=Clostridium aceticum TaxID=84022 RepID=A0A0G3WHS9_9CLOT|nr:sensor histidine kinase [Clostridium aceticum]AKL97009.1 sensor histidine kinase ResE [Clostridium aceticum]
MKYLSIRIKLLTLILIALIPLIIFQYVGISEGLKRQTQRELLSNVEYAEAVSKVFVSYIEEVWVQQEIVSRFITSQRGATLEEVQFDLEEIQSANKVIAKMHFLNLNGTILASSAHEDIGLVLRERNYFQRVLKGEENVISDLVVNSRGELVLPVATGIKRDEELIGVIVSVVDIEKLQSRFPSFLFDEGSRFTFIDTRGNIVYCSDPNVEICGIQAIADHSTAWQALGGEVVKTTNYRSEIDGTLRIRVAYPIKEIGWVCVVSSNLDVVLKEYHNQARNSTIILTIVSLLSIGGAILLGNRILHPMTRLKDAAYTLAGGDYSVRTNVTGRDEIAVTAQVFDYMAGEIQQYDKFKTQFFSNLSHELKTPINVIFAAVQLLIIKQDDKQESLCKTEMQKFTKTIKQNCYRLSRLINNLIDMSRYDGGYLKIRLRNYNIVALVEEITMSVTKYAETKEIMIVFDTEVEEKVIACDPDFIERIILNLLSNAIKFTERKGSIFINIYHGQKGVVISVKDTGIGIPEEQLETIFERFRQVDTSLSRKNEGSGIGLSLVKALVEMQKGTITVKSQLGVGTEFTIELPANKLREKDIALCNEAVYVNNTAERISIEFSDIYSIHECD